MSNRNWAALTATLALVVVLTPPADAQRRRDREILAELETRVGVLEQQIRADNVVALINAQDELRREIQALRDLVERLDEELKSNAELRRSQFTVLEGRLAALESSGLAAAPTGPPNAGGQAGGPVDVSAPAAGALPGPQPEQGGQAAAGSQENYEQARTLLGSGQYDAAGAEFLRYLQANTGGTLAANARYWLGETYYVRGQYQEAGVEFSRVVADYPDSNKLPDAMLKLGYTQDELGDTAAAMMTLERVRQDFAGADAANLATIRLAQIESRSR